jgi:hypothetical protein
VSPQAKDMTDKQRRWWFAHGAAPEVKVPDRSPAKTNRRKERSRARQDARLGVREWQNRTVSTPGHA